MTPTTRRPRQAMPGCIAALLEARGLLEAYAARPPYQRNDYLGWIARAKRPETRERRLRQMLDELAVGERYMNMNWRTGRAGHAAELPANSSEVAQ